ncbi:cation diffusion facilitator family transporter [Cucumibacter marinus]|uniref:cation diffusion facilitator family transporter n=1 Tax=Cucumibacter marinus TaxID=1121252 RepID=UPI0004247593|nr:cation diffusion facilitator family transporter [Cucumibacter marinus]
MSATLKLALGSIVVGLLVLGLKTIAAALTGSVALFSDALESVVNVATAIAALIAVRVSARPADATHPFGHHKAEYFAAVVEGALIVLAAGLILNESARSLLDPRTMDQPVTGLAINAVAGVINGVWAYVLLTRGKRLRSPALVADGRHLLTDVITSFGVIVGLVLAVATGWTILDPIFAAIVALNILWSGWAVIQSSINGLMDGAAPDDELDLIRTAIQQAGEGAIEVHDLRTRRAGTATFVEFHLVVPTELTVKAAHEICDRIEHAIGERIEHARVTIHVEPAHKSKRRPALRLSKR